MSKSTPADLSVAFRSLERRRREAMQAADGAPIDGLLRQLDEYIHAAATLLGTAPNAGAVADAIAVKSTEDWDEATLDALREHATGAGTALRRVNDAAGRTRDDDLD